MGEGEMKCKPKGWGRGYYGDTGKGSKEGSIPLAIAI